MSHPEMPVPVTIELPANFPITFDPPELQLLPFMQDRQHTPAPMTPMSAWYAANGFAAGASRAMANYEVPMGFTVGHFNYYYYMAVAPNIPPELMPAQEVKAQAALMPAVATFRQRWDAEWLPELQRTWDEWAAFDLAGASTERLVARLDELLALFQRIWEIHFNLLVPGMVGFSEFRLLYNQLFPDAGDLDAYRLLQGFGNKSLETDREIWKLARKVASQPALAAVVRESAPDELAGKLRSTPGGEALLRDVAAVTAIYGRRSDTVQEFADPSWTEDPKVFFTNLKAYLDQEEDPEDRRKAMEGARENSVAAAREALAGHPAEARGAFEALLAAAQNTSFLQEDHNYWIDQRGLHEGRQVCMELGRRLVANGQLAAPDDIFMFAAPEAAELARSGADGKGTAAARRAEMEHFATITPPPFVGTDYGPPPDNPVVRAITRFFGAPAAEGSRDLIRGNAGSSGKVRGIARIVPALVDADRLAPGEILVTPTTSPPWTPLFAFASAVVTDTGGALSHCAIVAREYGIPCVVGAAGATARIRDGQEIEVDGDAGTVRLL